LFSQFLSKEAWKGLFSYLCLFRGFMFWTSYSQVNFQYLLYHFASILFSIQFNWNSIQCIWIKFMNPHWNENNTLRIKRFPRMPQTSWTFSSWPKSLQCVSKRWWFKLLCGLVPIWYHKCPKFKPISLSKWKSFMFSTTRFDLGYGQ